MDPVIAWMLGMLGIVGVAVAALTVRARLDRRARRDPIVESHGDWTITIYDDQPIADGQKYAVKARIVIAHKGRVWREGLRDSYTIWTVLAHWKDGLPADPFATEVER